MFQKKLLSASIALVATLGSTWAFAADKASDDQIEEITVTGIRGSLSKALDIRRNSDQIVDAIVAEDIGKLPDNSVLEAMQHITGVQVGVKVKGEGSSVVIRGSDSISTTINGQEVYTGNGRSMSLADMPATMVADIQVYKSSQADMIEGGNGGSVNVRMRRPFDFDGSKVSVAAKGIYNDQSEKTDANLSALASNRWETSAGEFGALVNVSHSDNHYREEAVWGGGFFPYNNDGSGQQAYVAGQELSSTDSSYSLMRDASGAWDRYGLNKRDALNVSLQWRPNDQIEAFFDAMYQGFDGEGNMSFLFTRVDAAFQDGTGYEYYDGTNVVSAVHTKDAFLLTSTQAFKGDTDSQQYTGGIKWEVNDKLTVNAELNYQDTTYKYVSQILDLFSIAPTLDVKFNDNGAVSLDYGDYDLNNNEGVALGTYFDGWGNAHGKATALKVDADYQLDVGVIDKFEFGVRYNSHKATNNDIQRSFCDCWATSVNDARLEGILDYTPGDFFTGDVSYPRQWLTPSVSWLMDSDNQDTLRSIVGFSTGRPEADPTTRYDISEDSLAAYGQFHYATQLAGKDVDGLVGVRAVNTATTLDGNQVDTETSEITPVSVDKDETVLLPNASFRINFTSDLVGRVNYGKTMARPAFADMRPSMTVRHPIAGQINQGSGSGGNPDLDPVESTNIDVALEWYFAEDSSVTATLFNRHITNAIVNTTENVDLYGNGLTYVLSRPANAGENEYTGLEVGFQYFPANLPAVLDGLGIQSSYTYIDGTTKLDGQKAADLINVSKNSYSMALSYEKESFGARLSYVYRDAYITGYNYCCSMPTEIKGADYGNLDMSMSYNLTDDVVLTLDATNLLGEMYHDYFGDPNLFNRDTVRFARTVSAGVRASF